MDLYDEIKQKNNELEISVKQLRKSGTAFAEAERDYKIELRKQSLILRDEGMPVTLIDKIVYGVQSVADARYKRDIAEAVYKANQESINVLKLQSRLLDNQFEREWGSTK